MQFYCESNQEILDTVIQAYRLSEAVCIPSMVCLDGVYLSYLSETVEAIACPQADYVHDKGWGYDACQRSKCAWWDSANPIQRFTIAIRLAP